MIAECVTDMYSLGLKKINKAFWAMGEVIVKLAGDLFSSNT